MEVVWDFPKRTPLLLVWLLTHYPVYLVFPIAQHSAGAARKEQKEITSGNSRNKFNSQGEKAMLPQPRMETPWRATSWNSGSLVYWCFSQMLITPRKFGVGWKEASGSWRQRVSPGHSCLRGSWGLAIICLSLMALLSHRGGYPSGYFQGTWRLWGKVSGTTSSHRRLWEPFFNLPS